MTDSFRAPGPSKASQTSQNITQVGSAASGQPFSAQMPNLVVRTPSEFVSTPTVPDRSLGSKAGIARPVPIKRKSGSRAEALDVAKYLVYLATCEEEPDFLSHLRLQKLLYYVQGWSLALRNKPMFNERIEAWAHGPVVKDVYFALASYRDRPILLGDLGLPEKLTEEEFEFIQSVWDSYKKFSASSLREMTHKEAPWLDARKGLGPADRCENEITFQAMKEFFTKTASQ